MEDSKEPIKTLARLERVDLRDIWQSEASHFTPWLANKENLAILGQTLGIDLELEAQERSVGPFRADILCKEVGTERWVLIENQLERTDHVHLGQLLTYASGLEAATIVWIAGRFTEEHRSTLDWLNRITDESFRFFGLEVELWRIATSPAAPKFNLISKPNGWAHSVAQAARAIDESKFSDIRILQLAYWEAFQEVLKQVSGQPLGNRRPQQKSWMAYPIGRSGFNLGADMVLSKREIRAYLYISGNNAKRFLESLMRDRDAIERDLGYFLKWSSFSRDCRISLGMTDVNPADKTDWPRQHDWLAKRLLDLRRAFSSRVVALEIDATEAESEGE